MMDASGEEGASVDWTTDDELEILVKIGTSSPPVLITNSIEVIAGNEEASDFPKEPHKGRWDK